MARLVQTLSDDKGTVSIDLHFGIDEQGSYYVQGHLSTAVQMICQRCMNPLIVPIEADVSLAFISYDDHAARLPSIYEPYIVVQEPIALIDLVEDELILALPIVPLHSDQACQPLMKPEQQGKEHRAQAELRQNPFAVLSQLKRQ